MQGTLAVTGDDAADQLVNTDPLALLLAMMLDQQVPMEWAFAGPAKLRDRLGGTLDASRIAAMDPDELAAAFKGPPALHRFPGSMAGRAQQLCAHVVEHHGGDPEAVWRDAADAADCLARIAALPGYGIEKSRIFLAILGKRFDAAPAGWQDVVGPFADGTPRSVADIASAEDLARVRQWKKAQKAKGRSKAD